MFCVMGLSQIYISTLFLQLTVLFSTFHFKCEVIANIICRILVWFFQLLKEIFIAMCGKYWEENLTALVYDCPNNELIINWREELSE